MHSLLLTRFLVAGRRFGELSKGEFTIAQMRICYEIASSPVSVTLVGGQKTETLAVVPDAWLVFERMRDTGKALFPILLEIDRGTMYKQRIKKHIASRIPFVRSGGYEKLFGTKAVMIVYATTGEREEYRQTRVRALCEWTREVLAEMRLTKWGGLFRFCELSFGEMYTDMPFGKKVWFRPDAESPVGLFEG